MKQQIITWMLGLILLFSASSVLAQLPTANVQIIHNAADPALAVVDVYAGGAIVEDDFAFREATSFLQVPAVPGVPVPIEVRDASSTNVLASYSLTFTAGQNYVITATGVADPANFDASVNGAANITFDVKQLTPAQTAGTGGNVDIVAFHGATDAPDVDVVVGGAPLFDNLAYGTYSAYQSVPAAVYTLSLTPANNNATVIANYYADLSTLGGGSAVVFASGFLDSTMNQNGAAFGLFAALADGTVIELPAYGNARAQIIHNSADPAAASVDVYLNGGLLLDDFDFRTATPYVDVPAGFGIEIAVAPSNSMSVADAVATFPYTLMDGETYSIIADGVLNPANFAMNPDMVSTAFGLQVYAGAREAAANPADVDLLVHHGATDAPTVDVLTGGNILVDDAMYTDFAGYLSVPPAFYLLDLTPGSDNSTIIASYFIDAAGFGGAAATIFASGFLDPMSNQMGEAFDLYAALPDGTVERLGTVGNARVQVVHNSADPAAEVVDIYLNGEILLDDFEYLDATPFVDVPANYAIEIAVAPSTSMSVNDAIATFTPTLDDGETYVIMANGVLDPSSFAMNPDMVSTAFDLQVHAGARETGSTGDVDLLVYHGSTDAPTVDVMTGGGILIDDLMYTDYQGYATIPADAYFLNITPGNDNSTVVATYYVDASAFGGAAATIFASGFFDPMTNQMGEDFGLYILFADGTVEALEVPGEARVQVIHNAADPAASSVDVYLNGGLLLDDFDYLAATPYVDVPADFEIEIAIAPANSASVADAIATFPATLMDGETYTIMANGVLDPSAFAANPDGENTGFTLYVEPGAREDANNAGEVDVRVFHGSTDAPTVDVLAGGGILVDDAFYSAFAPYFSVPAGAYVLDLTPGADNSNILFSYDADLTTLGDLGIVVFASGFLDPSANQNGASFGLYAALPDGTVVPLSLATNIEEDFPNNASGLLGNYPNPVTSMTTISYFINQTEEVSLNIYNQMGVKVAEYQEGVQGNGIHRIELNANELPAGTYYYELRTSSVRQTSKMVIVR